MKAITYSSYGPPEVLHLEELARPVPGDDEVLIRVVAAEATRSDCEMRAFRFAVLWFWLPMRLALGVRRPKRRILGAYFSGVVEALGRDVTGLAVGDEVFGCSRLRLGAYGEYLTLPARYTIVAKPDNMTFAEAAAVPLGGLNALHFMRLADIRPGDAVLVNGAGGSIGAYAVQIAVALGARVTAVDRADKADGLRRLGATRFIDYARTDFTAEGRRYRVIFDMVPGSAYGACLRALEPDGCYLVGNPRLSTLLRAPLTGWFSRRTVRVAFAAETRAELRALKDMIEARQIGSIVDTVYPLEQAAQAHRRVEAEQRVGAVVLAVGPEAGARSAA